MAGTLTDTALQIALTYDDADWTSADGAWPLTCTNSACVSLVCSADLDGDKTGDADAAQDIIALQQDLLQIDEEMEEVSAPAVTTFGETSGVYWVNRYDYGDAADVEHAFSVLTLSPANRVVLTCIGETENGAPVDGLFADLMAGVELF